jgi:hypothetical protein
LNNNFCHAYSPPSLCLDWIVSNYCTGILANRLCAVLVSEAILQVKT